MKRLMIGALALMMAFTTGPVYYADNAAAPAATAPAKPKVITIKLDEALKEAFLEKQKPSTSDTTSKKVTYTEKDNVITLNLNDALTNIEFDNKTMQLEDLQVSLAKSQYYNALEQAAAESTNPDTSDTDARKRELLNWRRKLDDIANIKHDRADKLITLKNSFTKNYIDALLLQSNKEDIDHDIANLDKMIQQVNTKIKLGLMKSSDIYSYNANRVTLVGQSNAVTRQLESLLLTIKKDLNIDTAKKIVLAPIKTEYQRYNDSEVAASIEKKAANNFEYDKLYRDLELTKLELFVEKNYYEDAVSTNADTLEVSILEKQSTLDLSKVNQEATLWNAYYNLKNLEDNVAIETINLDTAKTNLSTIKAKVKLGKATSLDELNAALSVSKQENKLQSAINEYMYTQNDFIRQLNNQ